MTPLRYQPALDQPPVGEQETIDGPAAATLGSQRTVVRLTGKAMHGTHAKATGLAKGILTIDPGLPAELAQGLFAAPGQYDALVRFSQGPPKPVPDAASGQRGMAIKVLGVRGPRIPESRERSTQDWVLAPDPTFVNRTAGTFLRSFRAGASKSPHLPDALVVGASRLARAAEAVLQRAGGGSGNLRFLGRAPTHPISHPYYSQVPVRYGDYVAKIAAYPTPATLLALGDPAVDTHHPDAFRRAMTSFFAGSQAAFDLRVQLCADLGSMPVDDAAAEWPESLSPYRTVARLVLPAQRTDSPARQDCFDERLAFSPANALEAHRPLGSVNRARMAVYAAAQDFRQATNHAAPLEPLSADDVPD